MIATSLMIEGQKGLTWARWQRIAAVTEELGFVGLFRSDHFTDAEPPDQDSLESMISLAYLADRTQHIHFGPLVSPVSFRDPVNMARQAAAIDDLSGGRLWLGIGAGWQDREHHTFGYELGDMSTRMARYEESMEVITRLLRSDEPVTFEGRFYQLREARLLPRPQRPGGPRIVIGGNGPKRTLPLAARYADVWNGVFISPEDYAARNTQLDSLIKQAGRQPSDVRRTMMLTLISARDDAELEQKLRPYTQDTDLQGLSVNEIADRLQAGGRAVAGTPDQLVQRIKRYEAAGAEEIMLQWLDLDDIEGLRFFAKNVLPRL